VESVGTLFHGTVIYGDLMSTASRLVEKCNDPKGDGTRGRGFPVHRFLPGSAK
jgi:hypothetical protein